MDIEKSKFFISLSNEEQSLFDDGLDFNAWIE